MSVTIDVIWPLSQGVIDLSGRGTESWQSLETIGYVAVGGEGACAKWLVAGPVDAGNLKHAQDWPWEILACKYDSLTLLLN
jgi:hypothetical protein